MNINQNQGERCPICGKLVLSVRQLQSAVIKRYECERCGIFVMENMLAGLKDKPWDTVKHLVSAWVRQQNRARIVPIIGEGADGDNISSPKWWIDKYSHMGFPETISQKLNALLIVLSGDINDDFKAVIKFQNAFASEIAALSNREVISLLHILEEQGYIKIVSDAYACRITGAGWLHLDQIRSYNRSSDTVFIAMWFDDLTKKYREAVIAAAHFCGYNPVVIDQQEYNDFIMNQVVSSIKQSRFLVADFTSRPEVEKEGKVKNGVRGGVYWEAGLAYGLGIPVIHTCEDHKDSQNRIHFDINQYNTIYWKPEDLDANIRPLDRLSSNPNFAERLAARVLATIGRGAYKSKN